MSTSHSHRVLFSVFACLLVALSLGACDILVGGGDEEIMVPATPTNLEASDGTYSDGVHLTWGFGIGSTRSQVYRDTSATGSFRTRLVETTFNSYIDSTAVAGTTYYYKVRGCADACGEFSNMDSGTRTSSTFGAPLGVTASDGTSSTRITITWVTVPGAVSYRVYRDTSPTGPFTTSFESVSVTTFDDTTAVAGTTYYYRVAAYSTAEGDSDYSSIDAGSLRVTMIAPPGGVVASDGTRSDGIEITWNAAAYATSYTIYMSETLDGTYSYAGTSTSTSYIYSCSLPKTYYFKVTSWDTGDESAMSEPDGGYLIVNELTTTPQMFTLTAGATVWFRFYRDAGSYFQMVWQDHDNNAIYVDIKVSAYYESSGDYFSYFTGNDVSPSSSMLVNTAGYVYVGVVGYNTSYAGDFMLSYQ